MPWPQFFAVVSDTGFSGTIGVLVLFCCVIGTYTNVPAHNGALESVTPLKPISDEDVDNRSGAERQFGGSMALKSITRRILVSPIAAVLLSLQFSSSSAQTVV